MIYTLEHIAELHIAYRNAKNESMDELLDEIERLNKIIAEALDEFPASVKLPLSQRVIEILKRAQGGENEWT